MKTLYRIKWVTSRRTWWLRCYSGFHDMSWTPYQNKAGEYAFDEAYRIVYHMQTLNRSASMVAVLEGGQP